MHKLWITLMECFLQYIDIQRIVFIQRLYDKIIFLKYMNLYNVNCLKKRHWGLWGIGATFGVLQSKRLPSSKHGKELFSGLVSLSDHLARHIYVRMDGKKGLGDTTLTPRRFKRS